LKRAILSTSFADQWVRSDDPVRRGCGYGLLYEASKFSGKKAPSEAFLVAHVKRIADRIGTESEKVRLAMGSALMGIGKRSAVLNKASLKVARDVGPIAGRPSGFNAVLGGNRDAGGSYARLDEHGFYWTATESDNQHAWFYNFGRLGLNRHQGGDKSMAVSVRCVEER